MTDRAKCLVVSSSLALWLVAWSGCEEDLQQYADGNAYTGAAGSAAPTGPFGPAGTAGGSTWVGTPVGGVGGSAQPLAGDEASDGLAPFTGDDGAGDVDQSPDDTVGAAGSNAAGVRPSAVNPRYQSMAPPLGEALPAATPGQWSYVEIAGALSRDGSPAGFYYKLSQTGDKNLMIYLVGGGACQDNFFCSNNPPNKQSSLTAEGYMEGAFNLMGPTAVPQDPTLPMWQTGIFKDDPANPVKDWNMVFIPYVTGDLYAGNRRDATVPGYTPLDGKPMQFVGRPNMEKFVARIVPTFSDAPIVLLTGSSAGGIGALLNTPLVADGFYENSTAPGGVRMFVVDDAGPVFDDAFTPVCLQKRYRELYGLNDSFPPDCQGCFNADGGGMVAGYLDYLIDKYPDNLLGGLVDSDNDEIMQLFFCTGYNECDPTIYPPISYPLSVADLAWASRFREGILDLVNNHMQRMSSYIWPGTKHQNLFMPGTVDRFYEKNGLEMSVAEWLARMLQGEELHLGLQ
jgi:hypothetical protein